jgi:transposase
VRDARVWQRALGLSRTVIDRVAFDEDADAIVVAVRPTKGARQRCGRCGRRSPRYDRGEGRRRWRGLDLGTVRVLLEADAPRVNCGLHGPTVVQVPWARHGAGHTRAFDDTVAWLAVQCSKTAVCEFMRIAWRTVGAIVTRVSADIDAAVDRFAGLRRIGIDEISYKRGHRFLTVVVDHDSGALIWLLRSARRATLRADQPCFGRRCGLDRMRCHSSLPQRGALRRPVPRRGLGDQSTRSGTPPGMERRPSDRSQ